MLQKCCLISFIIIFIYIYLYVTLESFNVSTQTTKPQSLSNKSTVSTIPNILNTPISTQLTSEIGRVLNISSNRILNLTFTGNISNGSLNVSFTILEPNTAQSANLEKNSKDVNELVNKLMSLNQFKVFINGVLVILYKIVSAPVPTPNYFNNNGLTKISDYAKKKYISVPNDASLTNFYKLGIDDNFNIVPQINM